jgi:hypothetical protein
MSKLNKREIWNTNKCAIVRSYPPFVPTTYCTTPQGSRAIQSGWSVPLKEMCWDAGGVALLSEMKQLTLYIGAAGKMLSW